MKKAIQTFTKLIDVKEKEKQDILNYYNYLKNRLEEAKNKLNELLRKEDRAKNYLNELIQAGNIAEIQQQTQFIQHLQPIIHEQTIICKQHEDALNIEKLKLVNKNVEVKKIEKVKDKKIRLMLQLEKEQESKNMDEISLNQFMRKQVMA